MQPSANIRLLLPMIDLQSLKAHHRRKLLLDFMKCLCLHNFKNHISLWCQVPETVIRKMQLKSCSRSSWHQVGFIARRHVLSCFPHFLDAFVPWNVWNLPGCSWSKCKATWLQACGQACDLLLLMKHFLTVSTACRLHSIYPLNGARFLYELNTPVGIRYETETGQKAGKTSLPVVITI